MGEKIRVECVGDDKIERNALVGEKIGAERVGDEKMRVGPC